MCVFAYTVCCVGLVWVFLVLKYSFLFFLLKYSLSLGLPNVAHLLEITPEDIASWELCQ